MALPPLIEALLRRSAYGVSKINARGQAISSALQPFAGNVESYYSPLRASEQSVGGAVASSLTQQGQQLGSGISSSLGAIQAPGAAIQRFGAGTATTGAQAGAAAGALSSADLERLQSQGTAEQIYAAALPRLAMLTADADRRAFLADAQQELADLAAQQAQINVENQRYAAEQSRQSRLDRIDVQRYQREQRQKQKALRYERRQDKLTRQRQAKLDKAALASVAYEMGQDYIKNQQSQQRINQGWARVQLAQRRQNESEAQFQAREARMNRQFQIRMKAAAASGRKPNASLSAKYGYIVDSYGKPILNKKGKRIWVKTDSSSARTPKLLGGK